MQAPACEPMGSWVECFNVPLGKNQSTSYFSSVHPDSEFDPSRLSVLMWHIKYTAKGDKKVEAATHPIGARHQHGLGYSMQVAGAGEHRLGYG